MNKILFISCILILTFGCKKKPFPSIDIIKSTPIGWKQKEACKVIYNGDGNDVEMPARVKFRGGLSARYKKNSLTLELDKKYTFFDFPKDDDWILNASYIDKTFMRHKINYDLFRAMNPEKNIAARSSYMNVSINHEYQGLYVFTEEINGKRVGLNKKDTLAMLFKDPLLLYTEERVPQEADNFHQQKFPKINDRDQTFYIEQFRSFLFDSSDSEFEKDIHQWVDLENIMDWHLLLLFSNNGDGILKNFYLYKRDSQTPFRIAIWDYDHSFGRDGDGELNMMERPLRWKRTILFVRLMNSTGLDYPKRLKHRWEELREDGLFSMSYINKEIASIDGLIRDEVARNFQRWSFKGYWYYDDNDYEAEKDIIRAFVELRLSQLDKEFEYRQ